MAPGPAERQAESDDTVNRLMNKGSRVTLWIEPAAKQIVKYTFDNVDMDFFPAQWMASVTGAHASMTMGQPFPDVWLPRETQFQVGLMIAVGEVDFRGTRELPRLPPGRCHDRDSRSWSAVAVIALGHSRPRAGRRRAGGSAVLKSSPRSRCTATSSRPKMKSSTRGGPRWHALRGLDDRDGYGAAAREPPFRQRRSAQAVRVDRRSEPDHHRHHRGRWSGAR